MTRRLSLLPLGLAALIALPDVADAHRRRPPVWRPGPPVPGYFTLKAGGYGLDALEHDGVLGGGGLFVGLETGIVASDWVEVGFTMDWFRRRNTEGEVVILDLGHELPVEGVFESRGNSTDLLPVGALVRLKMPTSGGRVVPFVSGALTWDLLRLDVHRTDGSFPRADTEWFHGVGGTFALGVEAALDAGVGFVFEAGIHESKPSQDLYFDGFPVDARVDAGGEFARAGLRFGFP